MGIGLESLDRILSDHYKPRMVALLSNDEAALRAFKLEDEGWERKRISARLADGIPTEWKSKGYVPPLEYPDWLDS